MLNFIKKLFGKTDAVVEVPGTEAEAVIGEAGVSNWPFPKPIHSVEQSEKPAPKAKKPTVKKATTRPAKKAPAKITAEQKPAKKKPAKKSK